jgi:hypothetical protein
MTHAQHHSDLTGCCRTADATGQHTSRAKTTSNLNGNAPPACVQGVWARRQAFAMAAHLHANGEDAAIGDVLLSRCTTRCRFPERQSAAAKRRTLHAVAADRLLSTCSHTCKSIWSAGSCSRMRGRETVEASWLSAGAAPRRVVSFRKRA